MKPRARDLGIPFPGTPGPFNAITDVAGVTVGHRTLISGAGALEIGKGPVRTGITAVFTRGRLKDPVFGGWYALNGNGEMTGTAWIEESGFVQGPIMLTNTHSVGVVRDAVIAWMLDNNFYDPIAPSVFWGLPVVAETYDGRLNDINGFHVKKEHVFEVLSRTGSGLVPEGNVGGGTGMICHGFKGGIGTASRRLEEEAGGYQVGVLVQANYGRRRNLTIAGAPVGREIDDLLPAFQVPAPDAGTGSIIVLIATDAPLLPHQLKRIARRAPLGLGRVGGSGANSSGDIFLAFSTANPGAFKRQAVSQLQMLSNDQITPLFEATIQATEEAIVNALVAAETMIGINNHTVYALPHDRLQAVMKKYNRFEPV